MLRRSWQGLAFAATAPLLAALIAAILESELGVRAPNMVFLCSVILAAIWFGRAIGLAAALFAFFIYNFYLVEPRGTFGLVGVEDSLTLLVFIGVALAIGGLAGSLYDARERAETQARMFSELFSATRPLAEASSMDEILRLLATGSRQLGASEVSVTLPSAAPYQADEGRDETPNEGVSQQTNLSADTERWFTHPVLAAGDQVATLAWKAPNRAGADQISIAIRLLAERAGNAIDQMRHLQRKVEMDALAQTEKLRTALLASISHDFRTPLATILASSSSLLTYGDKFSEATRADLLSNIQDEAESLSRFVNNILDMSRLDAGVLRPCRQWIDPVEVLESVEERARRRIGQQTLLIQTPAAAPAVYVDPTLLAQALMNVVENALAHAPPEASITISLESDESQVTLWVEDDGPGVDQSKLGRVFDKFYQATGPEKSGGAGLGLAISKGFAEAMDAKVTALSPVRDGRGFRVAFAFPRQIECDQ